MSILSGNPGQKTFLLEYKNNDKNLNSLGALNFLRNIFKQTLNAQAQSKCVLFDVS